MRAAQLKAVLPRELLASVVVFLVALPLCMGIAIASGMPPAKGLITDIECEARDAGQLDALVASLREAGYSVTPVELA